MYLYSLVSSVLLGNECGKAASFSQSHVNDGAALFKPNAEILIIFESELNGQIRSYVERVVASVEFYFLGNWHKSRVVYSDCCCANVICLKKRQTICVANNHLFFIVCKQNNRDPACDRVQRRVFELNAHQLFRGRRAQI